MRIGFGVNVASSHAAGMSSLWHDPDFIPESQFAPPRVARMFDDMPLPVEQHELPEGVADPFAKLDAVYDVAGAQMERGIKGAQFLHGKPPVIDATPMTTTDVDDRHTLHSAAAQAVSSHKKVPLPSPPPPMVQDPDPTKREGVGDAVAMLMSAAPMVASQAVAGAIQGPLPVMASQAVQVTGGAVSAAEVAAAGIAKAMDAEASTSTARPRRGMRKADDDLTR
jgi:hypothetical protein